MTEKLEHKNEDEGNAPLIQLAERDASFVLTAAMVNAGAWLFMAGFLAIPVVILLGGEGRKPAALAGLVVTGISFPSGTLLMLAGSALSEAKRMWRQRNILLGASFTVMGFTYGTLGEMALHGSRSAALAVIGGMGLMLAGLALIFRQMKNNQKNEPQVLEAIDRWESKVRGILSSLLTAMAALHLIVGVTLVPLTLYFGLIRKEMTLPTGGPMGYVPGWGFFVIGNLLVYTAFMLVGADLIMKRRMMGKNIFVFIPASAAIGLGTVCALSSLIFTLA